jgi:hypothetical protein
MRAIAACLRIQGQARRAGRRKLPQIPGDLPTTSSERCVRRIATSLPLQGPIGRTRRRKLPQVSRDLQRALVKGADWQCYRVVRHRSTPPARTGHPEGRLSWRPSFISGQACDVAYWPETGVPVAPLLEARHVCGERAAEPWGLVSRIRSSLY